jgi:holo-[acyl-carrier protein] synthase
MLKGGQTRLMQVYQGIDLVEIGKFKRVFDGKTMLLEEIFTEQERAYCFSYRDPWQHLAARFACKEAGIKALEIGFVPFGATHIFREIEVLSRDSGKPRLLFHEWVARISRKRGVEQTSVSISHAGNYCVATVILIGG